MGTGGPGIEVQETHPSTQDDPTGLAEPSSPETGTRIVPGENGVELGLYDLPEDAEIRVLWVEGEQAGIFAEEGTRFRTEAGRLEAHSPPGGVRVEIPSSLGRVLLTLDGNILLRKSGPDVEILGTVQRQTPREIVFGPGSPPNEGQR
jgi:hypothetical protein